MKIKQKNLLDALSMSQASILIQQALLASKANGKRPIGRPRTRWNNYNNNIIIIMQVYRLQLDLVKAVLSL